MSGTVGVKNTAAFADWMKCSFRVNATQLPASLQKVYIEPGQTGICTSTAATTVGAGFRTVQFWTEGMATATLEADNGTWWAIMTPQP